MELSAALDYKAAPEMSLQLGRLYEYMTDRLREANFQQSEKPLIEVEGMLRMLGESWSQLAGAEAEPGTARGQQPKNRVPRTTNPWAQPTEPRSYGTAYTL
jgi:flagellar protein FliS